MRETAQNRHGAASMQVKLLDVHLKAGAPGRLRAADCFGRTRAAACQGQKERWRSMTVLGQRVVRDAKGICVAKPRSQPRQCRVGWVRGDVPEPLQGIPRMQINARFTGV